MEIIDYETPLGYKRPTESEYQKTKELYEKIREISKEFNVTIITAKAPKRYDVIVPDEVKVKLIEYVLEEKERNTFRNKTPYIMEIK